MMQIRIPGCISPTVPPGNFWVIFALPDLDPDPAIQINADPQPYIVP